jgi:hypothetical protein
MNFAYRFRYNKQTTPHIPKNTQLHKNIVRVEDGLETIYYTKGAKIRTFCFIPMYKYQFCMHLRFVEVPNRLRISAYLLWTNFLTIRPKEDENEC